MTKNTKIAVLGPAGTFCDVAANLLCYPTTKIYYPSIDDTMHAVGNGCDAGLVPIENTLDGYVQRTLDLLLELPVHITGELTLPVHFSFSGCGETLKDIHTVYVQFKANGQCRKFLESLGAKIISTGSNAESFISAQESGEGFGAVIPRHMLAKSDATLKIDDVTDARNNFTRFVTVACGAFSRFEAKSCSRIRVPLFIMPKTDRPGMLFEMLGEFSKRHINLISIMSRPTKTRMGTYNFYIEVDGPREQLPDIEAALSHILADYGVKVLGMYSE